MIVAGVGGRISRRETGNRQRFSELPTPSTSSHHGKEEEAVTGKGTGKGHRG